MNWPQVVDDLLHLIFSPVDYAALIIVLLLWFLKFAIVYANQPKSLDEIFRGKRR